MKAWEDFKLVDGVKMWRSNCEYCGREYYNKSPYARSCGDKHFHAKLRQEAKSRGVRKGMRPKFIPRCPEDESIY